MKNTQHALPHDDPKTKCTTAKISAKELKDLISFLNIIKSDFRVFNLVGGVFRAYSWSRACVVETEFRFFKDMHFEVSQIDQFKKAISKLVKKTPFITVTVDDSFIIFEDYLADSQLSFTHSNPEDSDNTFVSDKEMKETWLKNVDRNKLIVSEAITKKDVWRINKMLRILGLDRIHVKHDENDLNKGFLSLVQESGGPYHAQIEFKEPLLIPMKKNHYFKLEILPTLFNKDDMYLKCYFTNDQKIFSMYSTKIGELFVNIYSKSELIEESEEEYHRTKRLQKGSTRIRHRKNLRILDSLNAHFE